jgi:hypothetical protein
MNRREWEVELKASPRPDGIERLLQAVRLLLGQATVPAERAEVERAEAPDRDRGEQASRSTIGERER